MSKMIKNGPVTPVSVSRQYNAGFGRTRLAMQPGVGVLQVRNCCRNRGVVSVYAVMFDSNRSQEFAVNARSGDPGPRDADTDRSHDRDKGQSMRLKLGAKGSSWVR
jgi:hypothetical protein